MSASKILWGQIFAVFAVVAVTMWLATQWTAWRLGYQPQLGAPWFEVAGWPIYPPPAFFWWWYRYDAYAPAIFMEGGCFAASGGLAAISVAIHVAVACARGQDDHDLRLGALGDEKRDSQGRPLSCGRCRSCAFRS